MVRKVLEFHAEHGTAPLQMRQDLEAVVGQLPLSRHEEEAKPLQECLDNLSKRRGPQPIQEIIPIVLARLGVKVVESKGEGTGLS